MKDIDYANEEVLEGKWEDFDQFLADENWSDAVAVMDSVGENGWENDAVRMNHLLNQAKSEGYVEELSPENIPDLTPEETDEEVLGVFPDLRNDDDKYDKI